MDEIIIVTLEFSLPLKLDSELLPVALDTPAFCIFVPLSGSSAPQNVHLYLAEVGGHLSDVQIDDRDKFLILKDAILWTIVFLLHLLAIKK